VFISSPAGDLTPYRDQVEQALARLGAHGSRFETWPSAPRPPLEECLTQVEQCDAFVVLLGDRYGSATDSGRSFTHEEYLRARKSNLRVFAYLVGSGDPEPLQAAFVQEVEAGCFRCRRVHSTGDLGRQVTASFLQEFHLAFKEICRPPHSIEHAAPPAEDDRRPPALPEDRDEALELLRCCYRQGDDHFIRTLATETEVRYGDDAEIMSFVFMAEVNAANDLVPGATSADRLERAVAFWNGQAQAVGDDQREWRAVDLYNKANALDALGRCPEAIACYEEALKEQPQYAECWKNLGSAYDKVGDTKNSIRCLEQAVLLKPDLVQGLLSIGAVLIERNMDPERGLIFLNRIDQSELPPKHRAVVSTWKAHAYLDLGRYPEGIAHAEEAIDAADDEHWGWAVGAPLYSLARRDDAAWLPRVIDFFQRFLGRYPEHAMGWAELGHALWLFSEWGQDCRLSRQAKNAFKRAADLGFHDDGLVLDRIAHALQAIGDNDDAEQFFRQAAAHNPTVFGVCLADFQLTLGRADEALELLEHAIKENGNDPRLFVKRASCHEALGLLVDAAADYQGAIELDPSYASAWYNLGGMYWNLGRPDAARRIWAQAIERFPDHEAREQLDDTLTPLNMAGIRRSEGGK